jgi:hypothetical protein
MTIEKLVPRIGTGRLQQQVRDRLLWRGALRAEQCRILGIFPSTSHPVADRATQEAIRTSVHDLATGRRDPATAHPDEVMLTAMAGPAEALSLVIPDRRARREAKKRAEDLANGQGIPPAVSKAIAEAQVPAIVRRPHRPGGIPSSIQIQPGLCSTIWGTPSRSRTSPSTQTCSPTITSSGGVPNRSRTSS